MRRLFLSLALCSLAAAAPQVKSGFTIEEIAASPLIESPVAVDWDSRGRMLVAERGGGLKRLTDADHDGRYDSAEAIGSKLADCGGIFPWREGVIVAANQRVLLLPERKVIFTGNVRGFEWGLDGWIYAGSGGNEGKDFRFRPDTGEREEVAGPSGNSRVRDDWGKWFGNGGSAWLWHYTADHCYLPKRELPIPTVLRKVLANYAEPERVFPAGKAFAVGSFAFYRDSVFGPDFATSAFICDPANHLVHREVLAQDGISFLSRRAFDEQDREFISGVEAAALHTAPDGSLIVVDSRSIYRVFPTGAKLVAPPDFSAMKTAALVRAMNVENGWQRDTAQRLLVERKAVDAVPDLRRLLRLGKLPKARLQALATLGSLGAVEADDIRAALRDRQFAPIRMLAVRLAEPLHADATLLDDLAPLVADIDLTVRRQLAFSLGAWSDPRAREILQHLAEKSHDQPDLLLGLYCSLPPTDPLYQTLASGKPVLPPPPEMPEPSSPEKAKVLAAFAAVSELKGDATRGRKLFREHCADCHRVKETGTAVGPDLAAFAKKSTAALLTAILDPDAAVDVRFLENTLTQKGSEPYIGILISETPETLTLRLRGGKEQAVARAEISSRQASGKSLMPDDFGTKLRAQSVADILRFLRN